MNSITRKIILSCILFLFAQSNGYSAGSVTGKITKISIENPSGQVMVYFDNSLETPADCIVPANTHLLAIDSTHVGGKAALNVAIAAKAIKADVAAFGKGECSDFESAEILHTLTIQ